MTICLGAFAQQLTYQSVIRDASQQLLVNTAVKANFTINFASGTPFTAEVVANTNAYGLLSVQFGDNTLLGRDWAGATMTVTVRNNATPSIIYLDNESRSVNAVPYALSVNGQSIQTYLDTYQYVTQTDVNNTIDSRHYLTSDSSVIETALSDIDNLQDITVNNITLANLCTSIESSCSNVPLKSGSNSYTGKNSFTDTVTVPSGFDITTTTSANCGNVVVNACDLWAVFDSVDRRMNALQQEVSDLRDTVNKMRGVQKPKCLFISCTSTYTEVSATAIFNDNDAAITSYTFYFSQNADMSGKTTYTSAVNSYTFTDLHPGRNYYVTAAATNSQGVGQESSIYCIKTLGDPPTVATNSVTSIAPLSAVGAGNVTSDGGVAVTERGICWRTGTTAPTLSNSHISKGTDTGSFSCNMTNLTPSTQYSVRAYAINLVDTSYGNTVTFTTAAPVWPSVTTSSTVSNITTGTTATCGGNVTAQGTYSVTSRGVCWSLSQNPTISDAHSTDGSGTGSFTSGLTGLTPDRIYYVRAYATSSAGTSYGEQISFRSFACGLTSITDYDQNSYHTVQIGNQCWLKENLRTTHYSNGNYIPLTSGGTTSAPSVVSSTTNAYRYYPNNKYDNFVSWGYLYNWKAMMGNESPSSTNPSGVQGICPPDWHVPSKQEFEQLYSFVRSQSSWGCDADPLHYHNVTTSYAKAFAAQDTSWGHCDNCWEDCQPGVHPNTNNASGLSLYPARYYNAGNNSFSGNLGAFLWSATVEGEDGTVFGIRAHSREVEIGSLCNKKDGLAVRCIHD